MTVTSIAINLGHDRRIYAYPEGGIGYRQYVDGIGWVLADDEEWPDVTADDMDRVRSAARQLFPSTGWDYV